MGKPGLLMEEVTLDFSGKVTDYTARAVTKTLEHRKHARPPGRFKHGCRDNSEMWEASKTSLRRDRRRRAIGVTLWKRS